jgi:adenylate cyclase
VSEDDGQDGITERVAAILAADAVGYSRLMADDEKATIAALDRARAVFTEHVEGNHGRVVDTAGDSVLSVFETTGGAVRASVAIQEGLAALNADVPEARRMQFRIGIHLGDIHEKADGTVYGDGVNVAARLEALSEPGEVTVSSSVHDSIRDRLDVGFEFLGEHEGKNLKTPVKAYRVLPEGEAPGKATGKPRIPLMGVIAAAIAAIVVVAGVVWWQMQEPEPPQMITAEGKPTADPLLAMPTGPSIAVLPFENLSGDPEHDYFADGISEDILTQLSRFSGIKVIARNSSFQLRDQGLDVREVGQKLGAQYVLEGSVRRAGNQLRVTVQLLDTEDGSQVWADAYDRDVEIAALFEVQDAITSEIAGILAGVTGVIAKSEIESVRRKLPSSLDSYECVLLGHRYQLYPTAEPHLAARDCLEAAVERDPDYAEAWAWLAFLYVEEAMWGNNPRPGGPDALTRAETAAKRALDEDRRNQRAHAALAGVHYARRDIAGFVSEAEQALAINPNDADVLGEMAWRFAYGVDWERGLSMMEKAKALNPIHPAWYHLASFFDLYGRGHDQQALEAARKAAISDSYMSSFIFAAVYGQLGRMEEAAAAIDSLLELYPDFRDRAREELEAILLSDPEYVDRMLEGLEKAGLFDEPEAPSRPVIAVLPFDNLSGDPEQDYFADGISEDILNQISPAMGIQVISRASSFRYRGSNIDASKAGEELGAQFLVLGSVRRTENAIRVTAELVEVETGGKIWSSAYDRTLSAAELFQIQDGISQSIVAAIADEYGVISQLTRERSRQDTTSLSSYECVLRAYQYFEYFTEANHLVARDCLEEAVQDDPQYAEAWGWLAILYSNEHLWNFNLREDPLGRSLRAADTAIGADRHSQMAWEGKAAAHFFRGEREEFHRAAQKAISINPNDVSTIGNIGWYYSNLGEYDQALPLMDKALLLSPFPPTWYYQPYWQKHYADEDFEAALKYALKAQVPFWYSDMMLASTHAQLGNEGQAASNLQKMLESNSDAVSAFYPMASGLHWPDGFTEKVAEGLERAGLEIPNANETAD